MREKAPTLELGRSRLDPVTAIVQEDEMVGWHHQLDGHVFGQALGAVMDSEAWECCSPRGCKESDMTEQLN